MSELFIDNLMIEVTRKCNLNCKHCLRGNKQNKDIESFTIDNILSQVQEIKEITFTGGEPLLNIDMIISILSKIMKKHIRVCRFYIVTNGTIYSERLVLKLIEFNAYCLECIGDYDDELRSGFAVSIDQYHKKTPTIKKNRLLYKGLSFYDNSHEGDIRYVKNEGNAIKNSVGRINSSNFSKGGFLISEIHESKFECDEIVYVNVKGDVLGDCDMSYVSQTKYKCGNVNKKPLLDILLKNKKR